MGTNEDGFFYVTDLVHGQWATDERDRNIRQTAALDGRKVRIRGAIDPGSAGVDAGKAFVRMLAGYSVTTERVSGPKEVRADPFSSQLNAGNVRLVKGPWNKALIEELRQFPNGKHDDIVDALSDGFSELTNGVRVERDDETWKRFWDREEE
jgi:predicted phage terminase large subunit-like protein